MSLKDSTCSHAKFYQQDIVQRIASDNSYGIVLRCWHDAEDVPPQNTLSDPMMRPLQPGEVGVSFFAEGGEREILPESELRLVDRIIQPGDLCKRTIEDVQSGVVTGVHVKGRIEHAISGEPVEGWKTLDELETRVDAEIGDYVAYDDWIGQVIEVYDESLVEVPTGHLVRLPELSSRLNVGEKGTDILPPPAGGMYNLFGFLLGPNRRDSVDTVIDVKHTVYAVAWLAVNQLLNPADAERKTRPPKFWYGNDVEKLTLIRGCQDVEMRVGDRVRLKDSTGAPFTKHGLEGGEVVQVQVYIVVETQTTLDVLWQDGTRETIRSRDLIPYLNPDEYDCWPGDHVVWKAEEHRRPAIVQSVNATDRTATILLPDTGGVELASLLELDLHGTADLAAVIPQSASEGLGVCRGDFVFIHREGTTNGFKKPLVPKIGEVEAWVREAPVVDGHFTGWRKDMAEIGADIAARRGSEGTKEPQIGYPVPGTGTFTWLGEVTDLKLDGSVEVTHPDSTVKFYPLERLTKLYDGIEQLEDDLWGDEASDSYDPHSEDHGKHIWSMDEDGVWRPDLNGGEWEEVEDDEMEPEDNSPMNEDSGGWADESMDLVKESAPLSEVVETQSLLPRAEESEAAEMPESDDGLAWKRFDVLPTAPPDHAFISSPPAQPSKSFLGRLTKEYRVLSNSLPDSIIVRAYEDRTDLLRSLILGPENTPYEDAPFVIDWMLDSNFPHSPPVAHFHSWTNGNGRVNPNLYEEGKVCLSILGTWSGDKDEMWSAARSSLLQAFVSIQGLVLVREPWFCEPAYDKLRGTEEGIVNSRLYNEKAYVLSRAFVRRALEIPLGGLEFELKWLYYQNHRLEKVIRDARLLIEKSKAGVPLSETDRDLAVPRLTAGGIITLERTLKKLQTLLDPHYTSS
ncbi:putative ubiquitin-conjugating enzyme family protein [Lyophyllum shimeji]|uniref:Ubiquitin-conjugating enzyme family protein n=1 Tax=Lyophyllum shimeji TaxID=47721 RepID=A0A9P3PHG8_LYOSH|nr:putative ubiquitin-conjugating enzyme family protein [Lyophyllum shimeji]